MKGELNNIVYVMLDESIRKCEVKQFFESSKHYILKIVGTEQYIAVEKEEIFATSEACVSAFQRKYQKEYEKHYDDFETIEELFAFLLYNAKISHTCENVKLIAAVNRASEFTGIDMNQYLEKYMQDEKGPVCA